MEHDSFNPVSAHLKIAPSLATQPEQTYSDLDGDAEHGSKYVTPRQLWVWRFNFNVLFLEIFLIQILSTHKNLCCLLYADVFSYYHIRDCIISTFKSETANFTADNLVIDYNSVLCDMSTAEEK